MLKKRLEVSDDFCEHFLCVLSIGHVDRIFCGIGDSDISLPCFRTAFGVFSSSTARCMIGYRCCKRKCSRRRFFLLNKDPCILTGHSSDFPKRTLQQITNQCVSKKFEHC